MLWVPKRKVNGETQDCCPLLNKSIIVAEVVDLISTWFEAVPGGPWEGQGMAEKAQGHLKGEAAPLELF